MAQTRWIKVTKTDAAKRQVRQAVKLWFDGGDPVSIHTLLYAAIDIIDGLHNRKLGKRVFFDTEAMRNARPEVRQAIRRWPNFFKHGRDPSEFDKVLDFNPGSNLILLSACITGLRGLGAHDDMLFKAFGVYCAIHHPDFTREGWKKRREMALALLDFKVVVKKDFLKEFRLGRRRFRRWGLPQI
jgi:hypothetical protein